jgi:hypothetical protein
MKGRKTLVKNAKITDRQLKDFILDVVNAADRHVGGSDDYLLQKHRHFFPTSDRDTQIIAEAFSRMRDPNQPNPNNPFLRKEAREVLCRAVIGELRNRLRAVWLAEYNDVAEWRLCMLQLHMHRVANAEDLRRRHLYPPSPDTPIELAIDWVQRNLFMLRVCRNPECGTPFFVAGSTQKGLCSAACVVVAQKAHKRLWWTNEKGSHFHKRQNQQRQTGRDRTDRSAVSGSDGIVWERAMQSKVKIRPGAKISKRPDTPVPKGEREGTLKRFLHNVVNAPANRIDHLLLTYASFFPSMTRTERLVARNAVSDPFLTPESLMTTMKQEKREACEQLREGLQNIWDASDYDTALWRLFTLQDKLHRSADPEVYGEEEEVNPPPIRQPVHQALALLRRNLHLLRKCGNAACETNRFFIAGKSSQRYCSVYCTTAAQQEFKTRWWTERGSQWRKSRRAKKKKSSKNTRQKR